MMFIQRKNQLVYEHGHVEKANVMCVCYLHGNIDIYY